MSYGQESRPSLLDRFGVFLSSRRLRRSIGTVTGRHVGDFGCGHRATIAMSLVSEVAELVLIDVAIDPEVRTRGKVRAIEGALPAAASAVESGTLDVVLCTSVLEHLEQPLVMLGEIRRTLRPGGVAFLNVPSWFGKHFLEFSAFRLGLSPRDEMDDHKTYYDPRELWPLLVKAGFLPHQITCRRHKLWMNTYAVCTLDEIDTDAAT